MHQSNFDKNSFIFFLKFGILVFILVFVGGYGTKFATGELRIVRNDPLNEARHMASPIALKQLSEAREEKPEISTVKTDTTSEEITIGWVGDVPPSNNNPYFSEKIVSFLKANDFMVGNLEGVLSSSQDSEKCKKNSKNCFSFVGDNNFAKSLSVAGFDLFNLANNHILDKGESGILTTESMLTGNSLLYSSGNGSVVVQKINGMDTAFLSFGHNSWTKKITDILGAKKSIQDVASKYPIVIVLFHGGAEGESKTHVAQKNEYYIGENRGNVYDFAHTAIDAGADLVLGSGPHVVRGIEKYNDRLIVYSAGNFLTTKGIMSKGLLGKGAIFNITINQEGLYKNLSIISTDSETKNVVVEDLSSSALNKIVELTKQDFGQTITADQSGNITFI